MFEWFRRYCLDIPQTQKYLYIFISLLCQPTFAPVQNTAAEAPEVSLQMTSAAPAWHLAPLVSSTQTALPFVAPAPEWSCFPPVLSELFLPRLALAADG